MKGNNKMKHFIDNFSKVSNQTFDCGIILDSKGNSKGKIIVRYTKGLIGYNSETGIVFSGLNFSVTKKAKGYDHVIGLFKLLDSISAKCLDWGKRELVSKYPIPEDKRDIRSFDRVTDIRYIKHNRKTYRIEWI